MADEALDETPFNLIRARPATRAQWPSFVAPLAANINGMPPLPAEERK